MRLNGRWAYVLVCLGLAGVTSQCSKAKTKSSMASFSVLPTNPIVIDGDSVDAAGNSIKGPWFDFRVNMVNGTGDTVTIVSLMITLYEEDASGNIVTTTVSKNPSDFDSSTDSLVCNYFSFGTWTPGQTQNFQISNANSACTGEPIFYIGGNSSGSNKSNFRYRVVVQPLGWFGTYNAPTDRFDTQFTFYTQ